MRQSGAALREVGTTNRTRVNDYTAAVSPATAMFLRVHPSNFRIEGFTERPSLERSGRRRARDEACRSSKTSAAAASWMISPDEPSVQASIAAGVDLVCFSGDKLLGGPQAGIIAGTQGAGRSVAEASADARAARRQDHVRASSRRRWPSIPPAARATTVPCSGCCTRRRKRSKRARRRWPTTLAAVRVAGGDDQRFVSGRRRQRAGLAVADGVAVDRDETASPPPPPNNGCARSIRRSSRASNTIASSSICAPCCLSKTGTLAALCSARTPQDGRSYMSSAGRTSLSHSKSGM